MLDRKSWVERDRPGLCPQNKGFLSLKLTLDLELLSQGQFTLPFSWLHEPKGQCQGDGLRTVSAILWPEEKAALQDDPIFLPMSGSHLQIQHRTLLFIFCSSSISIICGSVLSRSLIGLALSWVRLDKLLQKHFQKKKIRIKI